MPPKSLILGNLTKKASTVVAFVNGNGTSLNSTLGINGQVQPSDTLLQPNTTTVIGDSVAVVTDANGDQSLAVIGPLFSVKPYEPAGWREIFGVLLFSLLIFFPIAFMSFSAYVRRKVDYLPTFGSRVRGIFSIISEIIRNTCKDVVGLRHRRYEDVVKLGPEAALYLCIHRETAWLLFLMSIGACGIILPIHLSKSTIEVEEFSKSTIQHLAKHDSALWAHTAFVYLFSFLAIQFIRKCRAHLNWAWNLGVSRAGPGDLWDGSIFIKEGLRNQVTESEIKDALEFLCPGKVLDVFMIVDPRDTRPVRDQRIAAEETLRVIRDTLNDDHDEKKQMVSKLEAEISNLRQREAALVSKALVTFSCTDLSRMFVSAQERHVAVQLACSKHFKAINAKNSLTNPVNNAIECSFQPISVHMKKKSSINTEIDENVEENSLEKGLRDINHVGMSEWVIENAPDPHDVIWGALHLDPTVWFCRTVLVNVIIIATLVLLTTPFSLLSYISGVTNPNVEANLKSSYVHMLQRFTEHYPSIGTFLFHFIPQLVLVFVNALLMFVVFIMAKYWEPHHTYSNQEISVFRKSFFFLLFNTLLLPSLAFQSLGALVGDLFENELSPFTLLGKVYVASSGAFTLCYIITQTWVGSALDMLRITENIWRCVKRILGASKRELSFARNTEFDFGSEYAQLVVMLSLCFTFSTAVPVILPFGICYFFVKGFVDHYHLNYICIGGKAHRSPRCRVGRVVVSYLYVPLLLFQGAVIGFLSTYVCSPHIDAVAAGAPPQGCIIENTAIPGTLSIRGTCFQLILLFALFVFTAAHGLYCLLIDYATYDEKQPPQRLSGFSRKVKSILSSCFGFHDPYREDFTHTKQEKSFNDVTGVNRTPNSEEFICVDRDDNYPLISNNENSFRDSSDYLDSDVGRSEEQSLLLNER